MRLIMQVGNGFQHYGNYIQDNQGDDTNIDDFIPVFISHNFRMQQSVYFFLLPGT